MFRKLVSNLPFSPALVGQLGFYASRLRREEATRRIGLIFTALALVVQSFAVFSPPEAVNASSPSDFVRGGVTSLDQFIRHYDANTNNIKDLFGTLGISRANLVAAKRTSINSKQGYHSWGMASRFSAAQGERAYTVKASGGGTRTFYSRPLDLWDSTSYTIKNGSTYSGWMGTDSQGRQFFIMENCGNLALKYIPPRPACPNGTVGTYPNCATPPKMCTVPGKTDLPANSPNCKVTPLCTVPGKTNLPANSPACKPDPVATCSSLKITKLVNNYQLTGEATAANGATIKGYTYVVKKNGTVLETKNISSGALKNTYNYTQTQQGTYSVTLTVTTSLGAKTSSNCTKTFSIPPPQMCAVNPSLPITSPECQPCPGDPTLWIKDESCSATLIETKTARNTTQGVDDATTTTARAGDKILYTVSIENRGKAAADTTIEERLDDVVEYASVIDNGNGTYSADSKTLRWTSANVKPGEKIVRMFTVQVADDIPETGQGVSDKTSYDCKMTNTFGNAIEIDVDCPVAKEVVEQTVAQLPHTGPGENLIFAGGLAAIVTYFYARSRQLRKEVRLIRRDFNAGTI